LLKALPTLRIFGNQDSIKANALKNPGSLDQLCVLQPVKRATNYRAVVTDNASDLMGAQQSYPVTVHEIQYIPITEQRNAQAV
jgi:hypothetical protein